MEARSIFWFRRDLRLEDNIGLYQALKGKESIIPIFIFDRDILDELAPNDARVSFIYKQLQILQFKIEDTGGQLQVFYGKPREVFQGLFEIYTLKAVYSNKDYEPYAIARDGEIAQLAAKNGIEFLQFKDQVHFEQKEIVKANGEPYVVFTPYKRRWEALIRENPPEPLKSLQNFNWTSKLEKRMPDLQEMGFEPSNIQVPAFKVNKELVAQYEAKRNFPAQVDGTSRLGPHLRFGTISVRQLSRFCLKQENSTFLYQLIWREFFMQILWHFPHTTQKSFKPAYDRISWRNDQEDFKRWTAGKTGYPLVDAGMRQLVKTGYMHNRVRMVVASFLCKHLLIDWRWGEAFFAKHLLDYELAANVGNWQWAAGSGVDAAPYFRIFNPTTQFQKFDPKQQYVSFWVPEWQELSYPTPMVDHKMARERCLSTYKSGIQ